MKKYHVSAVFVPGGMPEYTYVPRTERKLEESLRMSQDRRKLVAVTGSTKSGKTVLTNRVFPRTASIWIDGGTVGSEDDFWSFILGSIKGYTDSGSGETKGTEIGLGASLKGEGGIPLVAKGKGEISSDYTKSFQKNQSKSLSLTPRAAAVSQLRSEQVPLIIDDFHYLDRDFQGTIIRALKSLIFEGVPVVLIAIPHRRYDAVKVEREMTGRLESISVPAWDIDELLVIPNEGFPLLNMKVSQRTCIRLAQESFGSPHLMQDFCLSLADTHGISETAGEPLHITQIPDELFIDVARHTGKVVFDKLAKGPRQRSDRIQRLLKNGKTADIYEVILLALANLKPGLDTIDYETLRSSIRQILAQNIPQAHEVTRVLEKMNEIAVSDEASTPVLDWEKEEQKLHITDPFFAFYLKWGVEIGEYKPT